MIDLIKNIVGVVASPLLVALLLGMVGGALAAKRRLGDVLLGLAVALAYFGATRAVGNAMLAPLEAQYPPLHRDLSALGATDIVVLGSSYSPRNGIPITAALDETGLVRIAEGVRLALQLPGARLIVSGGNERPGYAPAAGYAELARAFGVAESALVILDDSLDTADEAVAVANLLGASPFILVTSAYHMPRAMRLMERAGANPIPAPTQQRTDGSGDLNWYEWLPSGGGLRRTEEAVHEYLGLMALTLGVD